MLPMWQFPSPESLAFLEAVERRQVSLPAELTDRVARIIEDVRREGDAVGLRYVRELESVDLLPRGLPSTPEVKRGAGL
jgi:histidinol dehydrogenase